MNHLGAVPIFVKEAAEASFRLSEKRSTYCVHLDGISVRAFGDVRGRFGIPRQNGAPGDRSHGTEGVAARRPQISHWPRHANSRGPLESSS